VNDQERQNFKARFSRVFGYIDAHLDQDMSLKTLAGVAAYSPFHFHRQFSALFDISVTQYVRLIRMRRAAHSLLFRKNLAVTEIAFDAGYESPESFSRAFRQIQGQSPSDFRANPDWDHWQEPYAKLQSIRINSMSHAINSTILDDVTIMDFPETATACLDHIGPPERIGQTIQKFIAWRKVHHLHPSKHATFNIVWCNPDDTPPDEFRMGLAVATKQTLNTDDKKAGFYGLTLPAGRCARLRHIGSDQMLGESALRLYRDWLPQSGETPGNFPLMFQRITFFPDVPEHDAITDIFLPLA